MRTIERRVDLDAVKAVRVSHQMATFLREGIVVGLWDRPSGGSYIDVTLTHVPRTLGTRLARGRRLRPPRAESGWPTAEPLSLAYRSCLMLPAADVMTTSAAIGETIRSSGLPG